MYDVRFGKFPRLRANSAKQGRAECDKAVYGRSYKAAGRRRQTRSAYVRFSMYDVRLRNSRALRGAAKQERAECDKAVYERSYKATGRRRQTRSAYVRFSMYDVRLRNSRALRGAAKQERAECDKAAHGRSYKAAVAADAAYVRCTIWEVPALARELCEAGASGI